MTGTTLPAGTTAATPTFAELGVPAPLVAVLAADGKTESFPIQADTLPDTLGGRDVLGRGKTGSGKTIAFAIPLVARLAGAGADGSRRPARPAKARPRGLVLAPTRELATQIDKVLAPLASAYGMTTTVIYGGVSQGRQVEALNRGVDIVVACPGRLDDLMKQRLVTLEDIEITVLDEADHMADLGFLPIVTRILTATPQRGQRLLFSATLDNGVDKLVGRFLHDQVLHSVDEANSPVAKMTHHVFAVESTAGKDALVHKLASGTERRILFTRTKHQAKKLAKKLTESGIPSVDLHGNLSQNARDRNMAAFHEGSVRVMVATDVAARGVHVDDVALVIHVDPPVEHKAYLHRSGRTARAGSEGDVVTVMLPEQRRELSLLLKQAGISVPFTSVTADAPAVNTLVGEIAAHVPYVKPIEPARGVSQGGSSNGANAQRKRAGRDERGQGGRSGQGGQRSQGTQGGGQPSRGQGRPASSGGGSGEARGSQQGSRGRSGGAPSTRGGSSSTYSTSTGGQGGYSAGASNAGTSRGRGPRRASSN